MRNSAWLGKRIVFGREVSLKDAESVTRLCCGSYGAASVLSLLIPAINEAEAAGIIPWLPALVGFLVGMVMMLLLDEFTPHLHIDSSKPEGVSSQLGKNTMLMLAVTLHNIPEGMAVGVVLAGSVSGQVEMSVASAVALALGIALQNMPEGAIISLPLRAQGLSRKRSFAYGVASGVVEPIAALITILAIEHLIPLFPYMLAAAAGAMLYVVVEELIPQSQSDEHTNMPTIGFAVGFAVMMVLDTALG